MQRFFTIIEGEGKGQSKPFTASSLMIVGRAQEADIHLDDVTNKVSRRHLQVRVEAGVVFVENMSPFGTLLNGKQINSAVSLDAGDTLKIGEIVLRYEERPDAPKPEPSRQSPDRDADIDPKSVEMDATRVADVAVLAAQAKARQKKEEEEDAGATRVADEDKTRMMNPEELGRFRAAAPEKAPGAPKGKAGLLVAVVAVLLLAGGAVWFLKQQGGGGGADVKGTIAFNDPLYSFSLNYPVNWGKMKDTPELLGFGYGKDGDADMARLNIYHDKQPDYIVTGLTDGFLQYTDVLRKRFKGFEVTAQQKQSQGGATFMAFAFRATGLQGKGRYFLDAESRVVLECFSPAGCYDRYKPVFNNILESLQLTGDHPQQFIDYEMPDSGMTALASSSPVELSRQVHEHLASGDDLLKNASIRPENLAKSMEEYRQALRLAIAGPERLPEWRAAAQGLAEATQKFRAGLDEQRLKIKVALKEGDRETAYWAARQMLQMIPDKTDPAYLEAYSMFHTLSKTHR